MKDKKTYYTEDLVEGTIEELEDRLKWNKENKEDQDTDDLIHEIADNNIPIYTYDLLQYASNNFDLLEQNDLVNDQPDVISIIQANIYELLMEDLYEYLNERKGE